MKMIMTNDFEVLSFNTASGMDCMQFAAMERGRAMFDVSIPQAVWIACNTVSRKPWKQ